MKQTHWTLAAAAGLALASAGAASAQQAPAAAAPIKIGVVTFLTGPAASPFGVPSRNAAEIVIEALNAGKGPAPYATVGFGGAKIEAKYVDESGSTAQVVTEYRNLVQRDQMDAVIGYISSGSCLAVTPVAEELKALTVYFDCGTPRIFEEAPRKYVFRPEPHATMDNVAAARFLLAKKKDITAFSGINQNYAWGQDSWRDFVGAMKVLAPKATVEKELMPKLFAGEYGAEISTLLTSKSQVVHTSFWDGDLEGFVYQSQARGLSKRMPILGTAVESVIWRLKDKLPDGTIIGARGANGPLAPDNVYSKWFKQIYTERYNSPPNYPAYQMALSILGTKVAWENAQKKKGGGRPTTDEVAAAYEGITFEAPSGPVRMALGNGHQGIQDTAYGIYKWNKQKNDSEVVDIMRFPAECVNPPADQNADDWIKNGMKGAKC
ncbi:ABC transporter substrate-binding protein [Rhodoplanes sp. Z2-YC6860]|uniref:ABC transporter substrate-binding protein n=1 Tax=Rhodoplanes sp. Z2-YC6860 TaxID=674703 RepID=UPI00078C54F4|nr:ABC transporter substrate-binding protein [Rhodoplanes sp. Z2-YC6860]AMN43050.1 ABC transporter substrate-binding protein [Rhodoplanes sp. Z2-YC6860]